MKRGATRELAGIAEYSRSKLERSRSRTTAEADRGRHPGFPRFNVLAGGPGSFALAFGHRKLAGFSHQEKKERHHVRRRKQSAKGRDVVWPITDRSSSPGQPVNSGRSGAP